MLFYKKLLLMTFGTTLVLYSIVISRGAQILVAATTKFSTVTRNICWHLVWKLLRVSLLAPKSWRRLLDFSKIFPNLVISQICREAATRYWCPHPPQNPSGSNQPVNSA